MRLLHRSPMSLPDTNPDLFVQPVMATLAEWLNEGSVTEENLAAFGRGEIDLGQLSGTRHLL
jgi:hypothetical protein